jgi:hypothetical protein
LKREKDQIILSIVDQVITITIEDKAIIVIITIEDRVSEVIIIRPIATIVDRLDIWLGIVL